MKRNALIASMAALTLMAVSCKDKDLYDPDAQKPGEQKVEANTFDFSTIQDVNLTVDYSAFNTYGPVFFSVYSENPFVGEGDNEQLDENITPIYEDYTAADGKFNMNIQLPAYAQQLFVVTGNFFVSDYLIVADVVNGVANAVATKADAARGITRSDDDSEPVVLTNDVSAMPQLSFIVDGSGASTGERIYKDWLTPLGSWDAKSGAPSYIIKPGDVRDELICSPDEIEGLFSAVGQALDANKACNEEYRNHADLTLEKESEVTITMLGGNTCWNSSLGYYYYMEDEEPQSPADLNVIMLFPNTQDGLWTKLKGNQSFNGNIGVKRGDAVQLKYYPNIANGGDTSEATNIFPKGIKIGFILKTNAWAMQGDSYGISGYGDSKRKYNVWATSTNKASYCRVPVNDEGAYKYPNPNGESRSAKFAYNAPNGDKYAIITFEDACNDQDYDDVVFALKPVNSFTPLPEIEDKKTTTVGVYAFEDLWPAKGDYDLNDAVIDFKHEKLMSKLTTEKEFKISQETFYLTTYQNYVTLTSGLAVMLNLPTNVGANVVLKKKTKDAETAVETEFETVDNVIYLTNDIKAELGTTYIIVVNYEKGQVNRNLASVQPFIFRKEDANLNWEMHIPFEAPTTKMNTAYFGTGDDASNIEAKRYFVRGGDYPFAFFLYGAKIESFMETILKRENESKTIDFVYPDFMEWSVSKGAQKPNWYLRPNTNL